MAESDGWLKEMSGKKDKLQKDLSGEKRWVTEGNQWTKEMSGSKTSVAGRDKRLKYISC